jgi:hypothetical protein
MSVSVSVTEAVWEAVGEARTGVSVGEAAGAPQALRSGNNKMEIKRQADLRMQRLYLRTAFRSDSP